MEDSKMKKILILLTVLLLLNVVFLCGEGKQEESTELQEEVILTFQNWLTSEEATKAVFTEIVKMFQKEHPKVSVKLNAVPYNNMKDQLILASVGGNPPDASQTKTEWIAPLYEGGHVESLNKYYDESFLNDFYESNLEGITFGDNILALPWAPSPIAVYANKNLINRAGHDPNKRPKSWEEAQQIAADIAALDQDEDGNRLYGWGVSTKKMTGTGYFFLSYIWLYGGSFLKGENINFDTPGTVKAYEWLEYAIENRISPKGAEIRDLRNLFAQGTLGFYMDGEFGISISESLSPSGDDFSSQYFTMPMPVGPTGKSETFYVEHDLLIPKGSEHKEIAAEFIKFLTGVDAMSYYSENVGGKIPARKSVAKADAYLKTIESSPHFGSFLEQLETARPLPCKNSNFLKAMDEISLAIEKVVAGGDPAEVVTETDENLKAIY
jgi:multiple sugar transport system substrate-binding protein